MINQNAEADYDETRPNKSFWGRMMDKIVPQDEYEEEEEATEPQPQPQAQQQPTAASPHVVTSRASGGSLNPVRKGITPLRIEQTRRTHITIRRAVHSFDDARRAADGLKDGQQQIVNLEQTPADMAERITDFLNGATYALEGSVEKIGEQVYLFTPSSVTIDVEEKPAAPSRTSFLD